MEKEHINILYANGKEEKSIPIKSFTEQTLNELGYRMSFYHVKASKLTDPFPLLTQYRPDIIIIDPGDEKLEFKEIGHNVKNDFPGTRIILLLDDSNIRKLLKWSEYGVDHLVYKGRFFLADYSEVLEHAIEKSKKYKMMQKTLDEIFFPDNYPVALFQLKSEGPAVVMKDFDEISGLDLDIPISHFLDKLAIEYLILTGQGHTYHESVYFFPAGSSRSHVVLVFSFKMDDPLAKDVRIKVGYFQLCFFIPAHLISFFPPISEMVDIIPKLRKLLPDTLALSEESLLGMKYSTLNMIRKLAEKHHSLHFSSIF